MHIKIALLWLVGFFATGSAFGQFGDVVDRAGSSAKSRVNTNANKGIDKGLDKAEKGVKDKVKKKPEPAKATSSSDQANESPKGNAKSVRTSEEAPAPPTAKAPAPTSLRVAADLKAYAGYDFIPGNKILFDDDFRTDTEGGSAQHWDLLSGQATLSKAGDGLALKITDGSPGKVTPLLKEKNYLPDEFTLEYDYYQAAEGPGPTVWFEGKKGKDVITCRADRTGASMTYQANDQVRTLGGKLPEALQTSFTNRWHHVAFIAKDKSLKLYIDQFRVITAPQNKAEPKRLVFGGTGNQANPIMFRNVRISEGGGDSEFIGDKLKKGKYISYGISFEPKRSLIRPESMGELTAIVRYLTDTPKARFEIGSYSDSDGSDEITLKLSEARANAVKNQLVSMGVDASRLTSKGYGKAKPIAKNTTFEGKAQNRRIEFVKMK